jgi:hypothetical protein
MSTWRLLVRGDHERRELTRPPEESTMSRYLLSVHMAAGQVREPMSEEDMRRGFERIEGLEREMRAANALLFSGRLSEPSEARVVRPSNGRVRAIDGPYAETKEQLGGFYIIEAGDLSAAIEWASKVTVAIGAPIEVRPFVDSR